AEAQEKAAFTSGPTSKCPALIAGPRYTSTCSGSANCCRGFNNTPAASPRQPACAAATCQPSAAQNSTGRQSAVSTAQARPFPWVNCASATGPTVPPQAATTALPCT